MDRTLVGYQPSTDFNTATSVVDDAASSYAVSNGGLTYTFHAPLGAEVGGDRPVDRRPGRP